MPKILLAFSLCLVACGGSVLERNVLAAGIARTGLDFAADSLALVCTPEAVTADEDPASRAQGCIAAFEGHDVGVASWKVWRDAIIVSEGDPEVLEAALALAGPLVNTYQELQEFLATYDVNLPSLPSILGDL